MATVRICVCGDEGAGKSSLITSLVKDVFVTTRIQPVLPQITLPPTIGTPGNVTTTVVDTSALPQERNNLRKEIRKSNVILLVYSDHYSYERVALFWMPYFRSLGVNVPVVLCANKSDLSTNATTAQVVEDEMLPVMAEFKEIDSCIRTSAREHHNINEVFFLCQKAVTHPIAPIYDSKESNLKPAAVAALQRIFYLCDKDQDGYLSDKELHNFQLKCFDKPLSEEELSNIKRSIQRWSPDSSVEKGIDIGGFLLLNKMFAEKGRHETIWIILRKFNYTDSLSLKDTFLHSKFDVPQFSSAELSPLGYRFFVDLFLLHDKDNDGGLNNAELAALFAPTPGLPPSWVDCGFPSCTVRNEAGYITLQGWLAQWSMTTFEEPKTTLEYLAYLGFESSERGGTTAALKVTKARKRRNRPGRVERNVFLCYVLGASSGKSSLLSAFLNRPFSPIHHPTTKPQTAVNSVELQGGKQCYLILAELGELEPAILENQAKLDACDLLCYTYDSSDPDSFQHIVELRKKYPQLDALPAVYTALKADQDKAMQRCDTQPDEYTVSLNMPTPLHVSVTWSSISEFFVHPSPRIGELEQRSQNRRGHVPQISISDDRHHVTEAIGGMYGDDDPNKHDSRPLSLSRSPTEAYENTHSYFQTRKNSPPRTPLAHTRSNERMPPTNGSANGSTNVGKTHSFGLENDGKPLSPPPLIRRTSSETAVQHFPLNDIDYESSPAAVAQELSNLQAIRRMSMNVDAADPDLPSFSSISPPAVAPSHAADEEDASRLFWVPARLHPELAPKEFKTFVEDRVDRIRRRSGSESSLGADGIERQGSGSSLRRKKSMLSRQIDGSRGYQDGADRLVRKRSEDSHNEEPAAIENLAELEILVNDPTKLIRSMSIDTARKSHDSGIEVPITEDMPILPPVGQSLKRSTRTTYRRGSLRKGERVPFSKRALGRHADTDTEDSPVSSPIVATAEEPVLGLSRVQTEPAPSRTEPVPSRPELSGNLSRSPRTEKPDPSMLASPENLVGQSQTPSIPGDDTRLSQFPARQFQSRIASNGRTTAPLPGYNAPVPSIVETPPLDGMHGPAVRTIALPERKSSHAPPPPMHPPGPFPRVPQGNRMGTMQQRPSIKTSNAPQTLEDITAHPSPYPGSSGSLRTGELSIIPTFEDRKPEPKKPKDRKDAPDSRKTSWGWLLGSDEKEKDKEKEKREKEEREKESLKAAKIKATTKSTKPLSVPHASSRLDVLQNSIDAGPNSGRGRESLVLDRESIKLEEDRSKLTLRKATDSPSSSKPKDGSILSAIFGGGKRSKAADSADGFGHGKRRSGNRGLSPEPPPRVLKPDIDYNWTRFSILEERAIYRMAHIKLANPKRPLYTQVLLSNFMYAYLAKVQMMHPQVQIGVGPGAKAGQHRVHQQQPPAQQRRSEDKTQAEEFNQHQRYQGQPSRNDSINAHNMPTSSEHIDEIMSDRNVRRSEDGARSDGRSPQHSQPASPSTSAKANGIGYSVSGATDYLGYPRQSQPFKQQSLWDEEAGKEGDLW
ncbi:ERMES complex Ca(2+)-binding regulatory GTPase gem1 [Elasticomyces elasticus]|nr:ERMES complex Ca(2+)-binding regulatory GTPase gem1 [Elasticomyces elasticus]